MTFVWILSKNSASADLLVVKSFVIVVCSESQTMPVIYLLVVSLKKLLLWNSLGVLHLLKGPKHEIFESGFFT